MVDPRPVYSAINPTIAFESAAESSPEAAVIVSPDRYLERRNADTNRTWPGRGSRTRDAISLASARRRYLVFSGRVDVASARSAP
ncbi:hypothetical protein AYO39_01175 [Actinobacteria bacterium SCGC AG-212-D09]|nr:hypothetical protein AYO39_01175 [Actinobacteria bacterium SCGC AG-212-D09]